MISKSFFEALALLEKENGVPQEEMIEAMERALKIAYKKNTGCNNEVRVVIKPDKNKIQMFCSYEVVESVERPGEQFTLAEAREYRKSARIGKVIEIEISPKEFGRIAATTAKQVITQKLREFEREKIYNEFIDKEGEILTVTASRKDQKNLYVNLGPIEAAIPFRELIKGEKIIVGQKMRVVLTRVEKHTKGLRLFASRTNELLIKRLMEIEVPEIYDGIVEIVSIVRDAGDKAKVCVRSHDSNVDPIGACVGQNSARINNVTHEINGEKIELIRWSEDTASLVKNALSPAKVTDIIIETEENEAIAIVPEDQLSLAIGKQGQNARMAAKLVNMKIDIKSETDATSEGISFHKE